jgi:hypothetical protein
MENPMLFFACRSMGMKPLVMVLLGLFCLVGCSQGIDSSARRNSLASLIQHHNQTCPDSVQTPHYILSEDFETQELSRSVVESPGLQYAESGQVSDSIPAIITIESSWKLTADKLVFLVTRRTKGGVLTHNYVLQKIGSRWLAEDLGGVMGCSFDYD